MAVWVFFKYDANLVDISFVWMLLLLLCADVAEYMNYKPIVLVGLVLAAVMSPVMMHLWVSTGTGNANYVFFQGLFMWLMYALGILDFCRAYSTAYPLEYPNKPQISTTTDTKQIPVPVQSG